jgi:hypothetical protein
MKVAPRKSAIPALIERHFPEAKLRHVTIDEADNHNATVAAFLKAVRKAYRNDCILLPPGIYPAPEILRPITIRALRPGTVRFDGQPAAAALTIGIDGAVWISGVMFHVPSGSEPALKVSRGTVVLTDCQLPSGIEADGSHTAIYLQGCSVGSATTGIDGSQGAQIEVSSSAITGCQVGITVTSGTTVTVLHSRVEGSVGPSPSEPGAGIHGEQASIYLAGNLFAGNQVGVHLVNCAASEVLYSRFEQQNLVGLMASGGGPIQIHGCAFASQTSNSYAHVTFESIEATLSYCSMDDSALPFSQSGGGKVDRIEATKDSGSDAALPDVFGGVLEEIHSMIGHDEAKPALETVLHQAYASVKRQEQGLPVLRQKYHMVFEGGEGSGRRMVASLLARALQSLGVLSKGEVAEARMDDLMMSTAGVAQAVHSAAGGILLLHAPVDVDRRDSRMSYSRARDVLHHALTACGSDTMLIFTGEREFVRPIIRGATEGEQTFHAILRFPPPSPPELAQIFESLCNEHRIQLTTRAAEKILLVMHMLDDRRDKRFLSGPGIVKFFELTHKRFLERCSRERRFDIPLESGDIESPVEKPVEAVLAGNPAFVKICRSCGSENPWMPGLPTGTPCVACGKVPSRSFGIWLPSAFYRRLLNHEDAPTSSSLPPMRRRAQGIA